MPRRKDTPEGRPVKPREDFPLFPHANGNWAKKIDGKMQYFGPWSDPQGAYQNYLTRNGGSGTAPGHAATKTAKPFPQFPLFLHANGQWTKKIRGKHHHFGTNRDAAVKKYLEQKEDLEAGRTPRPPDGQYHLTVEDMVNLCLTRKEDKVASGELRRRTFKEYRRAGRRLVRVLGRNRLVEDLTPGDFAKVRRDLQRTAKSLSTIKSDIRKMMVFFNFAEDEGYVEKAIRTGEAFKSPTAAAMRRERAQRDERMFSAEQIRALLAAANPQMKAMILLGINCAFGNTDCATLMRNKLDLDRGWHNFPRPKTGVARHAPLWPETVKALQAVLAHESKYPEYRGRVFPTEKRKEKADHVDDGRRISKYFRLLADEIGMPKDSPNFYALRHTFVTIAVETRDKDAVRTITGHAPKSGDMLDVYNEADVAEDRLLVVSNHVRRWLFKQTASSPADPAGGAA